MTGYDAVLFISFGGPDKKEDVMSFLEIVTKGRGIPHERLLDVAEHYYHLGGRSPINDITRRQANALENELRAHGVPLPVYVGQRNWHPFLEETLRKMKADGIRRAVGFITAAHRSEASLERYVVATEEARQKVGPDAPVIDYVDSWFDHPLFIDAVAARVQEKPVPPGTPWYFIAHSIPCAMARASTYVDDLEKTAERVCTQLGQQQWKLAYSSRSGSPHTPWLIPDVNDVIREEAAKGHRDILFITIGFIADHVEVLFDQDVEAQATAQQAGIRLHRTATVGEHPLFVRLMADVVRKRLSGLGPAGRPSSLAPASRCFCYPGQENPPCQKAASPSPSIRHG